MPAKDGFQLQGRDVELLALTHHLGIATADHFARHAECSYHVIYKRAAKLEQWRYLSRITKQPEKAMYQLGPEGISILIEHGYAPETLLRMRLRHNELKPLGRAHSLHIANIHATLIHETRTRPEKLVVWRQDPSLNDTVMYRDDGGRHLMLPVRPDAYFIIEYPAGAEGPNQVHFFLEADRGTMSHEAMTKKIMAYLAYYHERRFTKKYPGMEAFRVLVVTESRPRADSLREGLRHLLPTSRLQRAYRFMPLQDLTMAAIMPKVVLPSPGLGDGRDGGDADGGDA